MSESIFANMSNYYVHMNDINIIYLKIALFLIFFGINTCKWTLHLDKVKRCYFGKENRIKNSSTKAQTVVGINTCVGCSKTKAEEGSKCF